MNFIENISECFTKSFSKGIEEMREANTSLNKKVEANLKAYDTPLKLMQLYYINFINCLIEPQDKCFMK